MQHPSLTNFFSFSTGCCGSQRMRIWGKFPFSGGKSMSSPRPNEIFKAAHTSTILGSKKSTTSGIRRISASGKRPVRQNRVDALRGF